MGRIFREKFKVFEGVFDEFTLNTLNTLKRKNYFDELQSPIKTGKEGDVYLAKKEIKSKNSSSNTLSKENEVQFLAIKIFRVTSANFKKITEYIVRDFRFKNIRGNLRKVIMVWAEKEFRNLSICHRANMNVPYPYKQYNNVIIMDYIDGLQLKDVKLEKPQEFFELLFEQMYIMKHDAKLIHGDLSEFNILVMNNLPYIIDMGQAMSIKNENDLKMFYDLYERDVKNVVDFFNKRYSLRLDMEEIFKRLE